MTKILCNRSCKQPLCLYTELCEWCLPRPSHTHCQQTKNFLLNYYHHPLHLHDYLQCVITTTTNNHLPRPSFDAPNHHSTPTTTTTWQCHVTSTQAHAVSMASGGDDLACQQTCHVVQTVMAPCVITIHINPGMLHHASPLSFFP